MKPQPLKLDEAQQLLTPDEALAFWLPGAEATYVFALTREAFEWHAIKLGRNKGRPGREAVEITNGGLFRVEVDDNLQVRRMEYDYGGRGYYAVVGPELRSGMRAAIGE